MPWCPKCKMEYIEGISVCPDCGSPLTESAGSAADLTPVFAGDSGTSERIAQFLDYSGIRSVTAGEPMENGYPVLVSEKEYDEAMKLVRVFLYKESEQKAQKEAESEEAARPAEKAPAPYVKKADKYEDMNSSAITLLLVGAAGAVFMILKLTGLLPFPLASSWLFDIVMSVVFLFFLAAGFSSLKRAKVLKGEISEEVDTTRRITEWFLGEYTGEAIDLAVLTDMDMPEEMKYFRRSEYIKHELNTRLTELEESYLEDLTENLYHNLYEAEQ